MTQEALKQALEFLEDNQHFIETYERPEYLVMYNDVIEKCKEALAQTQEPIAMLFGSLPVYDRTTPPQRTWVDLTDEDISEIVRGTHNTGSFVRAIEARLKEKNK
jgi:hypothetical protein